MAELKLTPMRLLALEMCVKGKGFINPISLSNRWLGLMNYSRRASSRKNFGNNSTAWKRLKELENIFYLTRSQDAFFITAAGREAYAKHIKNAN